MAVKIEVGQLWADLDMRNAEQCERGAVKPRTVEILELPIGSRQGVMVVKEAPLNPRSVGQKRQFTEGKLRAHYALVRRSADGLGNGIEEAQRLGVVG